MGSSDNILALITGALATTQKYGDKFLDDAFARRRAREEREGEFDLYQRKQPIELQQQKSLAQFKTDIEPQVPLYNTATEATTMPPAGTKKFDTFTPTLPTAGGEPVFLKSEIMKMGPTQRMKLPKHSIVDDITVDIKEDTLNVPGFELTGEVTPDKTEAKKLREGKGEYDTFIQGLNDYRNLISQYGTTEVLDRGARGQLQSAAKNLQLKVKNLAQLGVLSFSDIPFIQEQIPEPGVFTTVSGAMGSLSQTEKMMRDSFNKRMKSSGYRAAIKRRTKDGRTAIFDENKNFVRYE